MVHFFFFCAHIALVVGVGCNLDGYILDNLYSIALQSDALDGVIGHETQFACPHFAENLRPDAIVSFIGVESQVDVRLYRVEAVLLQFVRLYLVHQSDAASFLVHIDDDAFSLGLYHLHGSVELFAAFAAFRAEDVACSATGVNAAEDGFIFAPLPLDERDMFEAVG